MIAEQQKHPEVLRMANSAIGVILVAMYTEKENSQSIQYPGWLQTRSYQSMEFDIMGYGEMPAPHIIKIWNHIDAKFDSFLGDCICAVTAFVDKHDYACNHQSINEYVKSIKTSAYNGSLTVIEIMFDTSENYKVRLDYPDSDEYYVWPIIAVNSHYDMNVSIDP